MSKDKDDKGSKAFEFKFTAKVNMTSKDWCDGCGSSDPEYTALISVSEQADMMVGLCVTCRLANMGLLYHSIKKRMRK